jgi:hypothetical protein
MSIIKQKGSLEVIDGTLRLTTLGTGTTITSLGIDSNGFVVSAGTDTNTFTTGATLNGTILEFDRNDLSNAYNVDLSSLQFTGNTSGNCVTDLYVSNLYGCSPITINDDIEIVNDKVIKSSSGNSYIDLRAYSTDNNIHISTDGDNYSEAGLYIMHTPNTFGAGSTELYNYDGEIRLNGYNQLILDEDVLINCPVDFMSGESGDISLITPQGNIIFEADELDLTNVTSIIGLPADANTFTTGATLNGSILEFDRNDLSNVYNVDLSSLQFTGNTSGGCITDLYVSNIWGCSPVTIQNDLIISGSAEINGSVMINSQLTLGVGTTLAVGGVSKNIALGYNNLQNNTIGTYNVALGLSALSSNTIGTYNTAIGYKALSSNTTGNGNITLGGSALTSNTTGGYNVAIGQGSLYYNTTGYENISIGRYSLLKNTTGNNNVALGFLSLYSNTEGFRNISLGSTSLYYNTTGYQNIALGFSSLSYNTTGSNNISLGSSALRSNTTGVDNVAIGNQTLKSNITGVANVALSYRSLFYNTYGNANVALGNSALYSNTTGNYNIALGPLGLYSNTTGNNNVALGLLALSANTTGGDNIALGYRSLQYNTTGGKNVALGYNNQSGNFSNSIILGVSATATANNQLVLGSLTTPLNTVATESLTSNRTLTIRLNGEDYKLMLYKA